MEDKYLEIIMKLSEENGSLKKENEYLKEELNKYKCRPLKSQEIRDKFTNIGNDKKAKKSASKLLDETLEKYRGK